jgi:S-adenosylmethionine:tRNA ribosyltransferase-isomerase
MHIDDFDFDLPPAQVAQHPSARRDASRLLHVSRAGEVRGHHQFAQLPSLLKPNDLLVLNDARVVPARLCGKKVGSGGRVELLVVRPMATSRAEVALKADASSLEWVCLGQASKGLKAGVEVALEGGLSATVLDALGEGHYRVRFRTAQGGESLETALARAGQMPLPPYIDRPATPDDAERYQTVYAVAPGSVAAPTAGLHFTEGVFAALKAKGIGWTFVTLDVGPGTFLPVREGALESHRMHPERYHVPESTAAKISQARRAGGRVVAVGTTVVRTLEASWRGDGPLPGDGETSLFITPGHAFQAVDALITNFHLPKSTLLVLVSALMGRERTLSVYREAVAEGYRFFSYGDAMLIAD